MLRTAILYALPALLVATSWLGLEDPQRGGRVFAAALLALLPALVRPGWGRAAAAVVVAALVVPSALGLSPVRADGYTRLVGRFEGGFFAFYDVNVPFDPVAHPRMHGVIVAAVLAFCLALALAVAARRPGIAALVVAAGAAWPATLVPDRNELRLGGFVLAAVLLLFAGLRSRGALAPRPALISGAAVLVAALAAASSPAVAKDAFLGWERWNVQRESDPPVSVSYVWDSRYDGIRFPKETTTVLRIKAPDEPLYWRATTLDAFNGYGWSERARPLDPTARELVSDGSYPPAARDRTGWVRQAVEVAALEDHHLVGASVPVEYQTERDDVQLHVGGIATVLRPTRRGERYNVWSYVAAPRPAQLALARPRYPDDVLLTDLSVGDVRLPPFGAPNRDARVLELFDRYATDDRIGDYRPLYEQARRVAGRAESPYAAVAALELWLRTLGDFTYDEQPTQPSGVPPLVAFVTETRSGYCQHFAGAMALMLRYLGIPARVAAGFTSGTFERDSGVWTITDHDAHTWVEVWFEGFGWLPFDPTPNRGALGGSYTAASPLFDVSGAQGLQTVLAQALGESPAQLQQEINRGREAAEAARLARGEGSGGEARGLRDRGSSLVLLLLLVGAGLVTAVVAAKLAVRRARYLTRDPRRVASACRQELVDFLRDQRLDPTPGATLAEIGQALERELSVSGRHFASAATAARYGAPPRAAAEARRARRELRAVLRAIRRRLTFAERARGLLSLRSLGFS